MESLVHTYLQKCYGKQANLIFEKSYLFQYIDKKTKTVTTNPKSRKNLANLYAIYVLVEDYLNKKFHIEGDYSKYEGSQFTPLLERTRQLPFGEKYQNHALNSRCNMEFKKFFSNSNDPIKYDQNLKRYWINESLLKILNVKVLNIGPDIIKIIDQYTTIITKTNDKVIDKAKKIQESKNSEELLSFIEYLVSPSCDARVFEIITFSILKAYYGSHEIFLGKTKAKINKIPLKLYKTGRTNANDGGIDFIMKPEGRFFQVTEDINLKKFFLDIDKISHFPITFVIKSNESPEKIKEKIISDGNKLYDDKLILQKYIGCFEEIISIPTLFKCLKNVFSNNKQDEIMKEFIIQFKVEFHVA